MWACPAGHLSEHSPPPSSVLAARQFLPTSDSPSSLPAPGSWLLCPVIGLAGPLSTFPLPPSLHTCLEKCDMLYPNSASCWPSADSINSSCTCILDPFSDPASTGMDEASAIPSLGCRTCSPVSTLLLCKYSFVSAARLVFSRDPLGLCCSFASPCSLDQRQGLLEPCDLALGPLCRQPRCTLPLRPAPAPLWIPHACLTEASSLPFLS